MSYVAATVIANLQDNGVSTLRVAFTGDAGEPSVERQIALTPNSSLQTLRAWAIGVRDELNGARTLASAAQLQPGQTVNLAALTPPVPTAKQAWFDDFRRLTSLQRAIAAGVAPAASDDALVASLLSRFSSIPLTEADF